MSTDMSKTALVLAGGGLTGAVYEIGALRAMDDLLIDRTVNDFDIFVGTSSGALVTAFLANGVSPEEMLQVIDGTHPTANLFERKHVFNIDSTDLLQWTLRFPKRLRQTLGKFIQELDDMAVFDLFWSFSNLLPPGFFDGGGLGEFIEQSLARLGHSNQFRELKRELYIIATCLDSGGRAVFGPGYMETAISDAVSASCAIPVLYQPVRIDGKDYIDGSLRGNASIDLAIEHGAGLIIVVNPMVPYDLEHIKKGTRKPNIRNISDGGFEAIANQLIRIVLHSNLHYHIKQLRRSREDVDIILIEPLPDDYRMFAHNIMRYSARLAVGRHGFEAVTVNLAEEYPTYKEILARHGIPITRSLVNEELTEISQSNYDPQVIRRILGARANKQERLAKDSLVTRLDLALSSLESSLDQISADR